MKTPSRGDFCQRPYPADFYRKGFDPAQGRVDHVIGRAYVVIKWPDGTYSKHHVKELKWL